MAEPHQSVRIKSGKVVTVPKKLVDDGNFLAARAYAVQTGQATWTEVGHDEPNPGLSAPDSAPAFTKAVEAGLIGAGRRLAQTGSNVRQLLAEAGDRGSEAEQEQLRQNEMNRLAQPIKRDFPIASFIGEAGPSFAVPGGRVPQVAAGAVEGALEGESPASRVGLGALGAGLGLFGARLGDRGGSATQRRAQSALGDPDASARQALADADVPLSLSQRLPRGGGPSRPLSRFFERAQFALTGNQPMGPQQQQRLIEIMGEALDVKGRRLTREVLGEAVNKNKRVFRSAAERIAERTDDGFIRPDQDFFNDLSHAEELFSEVGSDSPQVEKIFRRAIEQASDGRFKPEQYLKIRSNLSEATAKPAAGAEIPAIVSAIDAYDSMLGRLAPELADDMRVARERFRLLLAVRRGSALAPDGSVNVSTLTKNLERVFRDFDVGKPLPGVARDAGEVVAGLNQLVDGFRSSGTAENALTTDVSKMAKALAPFILSVSGGGTGALLGGGAARSLLQLPLTEPSVFRGDTVAEDPEFRKGPLREQVARRFR